MIRRVVVVVLLAVGMLAGNAITHNCSACHNWGLAPGASRGVR